MQLSPTELARAPAMLELMFAVFDPSLEVEIAQLRQFDPELELELDLLRTPDLEVELELVLEACQVTSPREPAADRVAMLDDPWFDEFGELDETATIADDAPPVAVRTPRLRRLTNWLRNAA